MSSGAIINHHHSLLLVQKYKNEIVCPANSWKDSRGRASQVDE